MSGGSDEDFPWHVGVYDAHCHPTDSPSRWSDIQNMRAKALTVMATRSQDQDLVSQLAEQVGTFSSSAASEAERRPCAIVPSFGWHPWFSHQLFDGEEDAAKDPASKEEHYKSVLSPDTLSEAFLHALPEPRSLASLLAQTRSYLERYPLALVGEIGLDKAFRVPDPLEPERPLQDGEPEQTAGSRQGRRLSPHYVNVQHQKRVMRTFLELAAEMDRAVSVHGVSAHGLVYEVLQSTWKGHERPVVSRRARKRQASVDMAHALNESNEENAGTGDGDRVKTCDRRPYPPRICLHSYSGPLDYLKHYCHPTVPTMVFFSFSEAINLSTSAASSRAVEAIKALPVDRILIESDLHCPGRPMDDALEAMARQVCRTRGWPLAEGLDRLALNWRHFVLGSDEEGERGDYSQGSAKGPMRRADREEERE